MKKISVIRDTREQNGWVFEESERCAGTIVDTLQTGDYTLKGFEELLRIERKGSIAEFASNVTQARFERELERLEDFPLAFLILEFDMADIALFPASAKLPPKALKNIKITAQFIMKRLMEFQVKYKTKVLLTGGRGKEVASSLFKRVIEKHG